MMAVNVLVRTLTEAALKNQVSIIFFANSEVFIMQERVSNTNNRLREIDNK